jgi:hypothetical protein
MSLDTKPPLVWDECPHGCGARFLADGQELTAAEYWTAGPWKMSVHLTGRPPGRRFCGRTFYRAPIRFTPPTLDDDAEGDTTTEGS